MKKEEIESKVAEVVCEELNIPSCEMSDRLSEDLVADSLDAIEILIGCEKEFDIYIEPGVFEREKFETVGDIADFIQKQL